MSKFAAQKPTPNLPRNIMENIIYTLFPEHKERHEIIEYENNDNNNKILLARTAEIGKA